MEHSSANECNGYQLLPEYVGIYGVWYPGNGSGSGYLFQAPVTSVILMLIQLR